MLQESILTRLSEQFYSRVKLAGLQTAHWVAVNEGLAREIGLPEHFFAQENSLALLSGNADYAVQPWASVYSGHQFGVYVPQLGDGRAACLGQTQTADGKTWEWQLKGAGKTPFSRFADGRAVLRSSIREYLASEAMAALGIPTTRALALVGGSDKVYREEVETVAIVTRLAPSFLRFGHFEYFYHKGQHDALKQLWDFALSHYFAECQNEDEPYLAMFAEISRRSVQLVAAWQAVGFCHGVLNTDNMSLLGLTIDYGPFGFLDAYDRRHVCNHSDATGRYAYQEQPSIVHWNLIRLASCLLPFCQEADLVAILDEFAGQFEQAYEAKMRAKLGLQTAQADDGDLIADLLRIMQQQRVDFTLFFRNLSLVQNAHDAPIPEPLSDLLSDKNDKTFALWLGRYRRRLRLENSDEAERKMRMDSVNPLYVLRNYLLEQAIALAKTGDFREIERLQTCLQNPFVEQKQFADFAVLPPDWAAEICVSCSS
ncbi:MAG: YdiU family protein [Neisseria sp.]|nr:YdiU family protein [Neisseria sp.]